MRHFRYKHNFLLNRIAYMYEFGYDQMPPNGVGMWGITVEKFNDALKGWKSEVSCMLD